MNTQQKLWAASAHLAYICGLPVILPLILFLWKRDSDRFVAEQAKQAVGLHVVAIVLVSICVFFMFATLGVGALVAVPALWVFGTAAIVFSIVACLKIAEGKTYHYPVFGEWIANL